MKLCLFLFQWFCRPLLLYYVFWIAGKCGRFSECCDVIASKKHRAIKVKHDLFSSFRCDVGYVIPLLNVHSFSRSFQCMSWSSTIAAMLKLKKIPSRSNGQNMKFEADEAKFSLQPYLFVSKIKKYSSSSSNSEGKADSHSSTDESRLEQWGRYKHVKQGKTIRRG